MRLAVVEEGTERSFSLEFSLDSQLTLPYYNQYVDTNIGAVLITLTAPLPLLSEVITAGDHKLLVLKFVRKREYLIHRILTNHVPRLVAARAVNSDDDIKRLIAELRKRAINFRKVSLIMIT